MEGGRKMNREQERTVKKEDEQRTAKNSEEGRRSQQFRREAMLSEIE